MTEQVPGWEGSTGPHPGQYGEPHVYARSVHSGAGNCVCGRALRAQVHVQAAPGVPVPGRRAGAVAVRADPDLLRARELPSGTRSSEMSRSSLVAVWVVAVVSLAVVCGYALMIIGRYGS